MKKLYRKGTIHPSPSSSPSLPISDQFSLSYLPAAVLTLAAALSADDKEVLAYLLSCSAASATTHIDFSLHHHEKPSSTCYCFNCYTSFWVRWDSSPNRQVIHDIIDALEDGFFAKGKKREKRRNNKKNRGLLQLNGDDGIGNKNGSIGSGRVNPELGRVESEEEDGGEFGKGGEETGEKQGSMRKIVSFIGERIWGTVWG